MDAAVRASERESTVDRETLLLGAVDTGLLTALILYGQHRHGTLGDPLTSLETVAPFVIGWLAVAALAGLYTRGATGSVLETGRLTALTWIAAANIGLSVRASPYVEGTAAWPFGLVITGFGLLVLVGWRVGYAAVGRP